MDDMNWIQRKIYLYNVTFGLYMLDWWERFTFNTLVIVLMCFVVRFVIEVFKSKLCGVFTACVLNSSKCEQLQNAIKDFSKRRVSEIQVLGIGKNG
ncbi:hypothetical protein RIF29_13747 [Crotalaria pallida]|uniref:Uncharacterized protein n=1 Tax=Crotalaria pallida TaxID=3830 RepID=A0AAN9IQ01_CROPI